MVNVRVERGKMAWDRLRVWGYSTISLCKIFFQETPKRALRLDEIEVEWTNGYGD
jgi:hypothetical protein